jgi:exopolyphosphatase/guanosine-5'-triphosphate,3'-diphosphate pyrophosphatase
MCGEIVNEVVAAVDCGTNSIRLLVAEVQPDGSLLQLHRELEIVRLGEGVDQTGEFSIDAIERTVRVAARYSDIAGKLGAMKVRFAATSATRDAKNRHLFTIPIEEIFGVKPEVISGKEEATLSFIGATKSLIQLGKISNPPYLVIDIGGGSTEFVLGTTSPDQSISVDIGCVRMAERHSLQDVVTDAQLASATADIKAAIAKAAASVDLTKANSIIGVAGTVTTVAAIALGHTEYNSELLHGAVISSSQIAEVAAMLRTISRTEKAAIGAMHEGRVDVIAAGALVLELIMQEVGLPELVVSEHDILDGLALSLVN